MSKKADGSADPSKQPADSSADPSKEPAGPSVAAHPRAHHQVHRAKGWGGLAGFAIAAYLSYQAGVPTFELGLRALVAGIVGYMLAWACAVTIWRHLVLAELRAAAARAAAPNPDLIPARAPAPPKNKAAPASEAAGATAP